MLSCTGKKDYVTLTDDDYFNFVVSLWAEKNDSEENNPEKNQQKKFHLLFLGKKFHLLCLGALAGPMTVLVNVDCHTEVTRYPLDDIGILTRSTMPDHPSPETKVFERTSLLRSGSKYYVLHVSSFTQN